MNRKAFIPFAVFVVITLVIERSVSADDRPGIEFFEKRIRPVLVEHCYECHSARAKKSQKLQAGLLLDTRAGIRTGGESGPAVVANSIEGSLIIDALKYDSFEMHPKVKLPDAVIADFIEWIEMGAPDPRDGNIPVTASGSTDDLGGASEFWAFKPPQKPASPQVRDTSWPRSDIDLFILAKLERNGISPVEDANRFTLLRRAALDLVGLPPSTQEIDAFLADSSPNAFATVVDRLLQSPELGERWARHWLDLMQYADTTGYVWSRPLFNAYRYRDYVVRSFNDDKPYNQFIQEQLAGDLLPYANDRQRTDQIVATGFLSIGPWNLLSPDLKQLQMDVIDHQIDKMGRVLLGLTLGCARCHEHKFDPVSLTDYYGLAGIFRSTQTLASGNVAKNISEFNDWFRYPLPESPQDEQNRLAATKEYEDRLAALQDELKAESTESRAKEIRQEVKRLKGDSPRPPMAEAVRDHVTPEDCQDCCINLGGNAHALGERVPRGFIRVISSGPPPTIGTGQSGRLQLARWIASSRNPLTARVMVNRIWRHLFGSGLVRTMDYFGAMGDRPSHPELLDYLAVEFMEDGWSIKSTIRRIMLSHVYQLGNRLDNAAYTKDTDNRLLWRMNRQRLDSEAIRDSILLVSGDLDRQRGGRTLPSATHVEDRKCYKVAEVVSKEVLRRRAIYLPIFRKEIPETMDMLNMFDFADPGSVTGDRAETVVPTQSLYLMNSSFMWEQSRKTAQRILNDPRMEQDSARIKLLFKSTLARPASDQEVEQALALVTKIKTQGFDQLPDRSAAAKVDAWTCLCQSVLSCNEFLFRD